MIAWLLAAWKFIGSKAEEYLIIAILSLAAVAVAYFMGYEKGKTSIQLKIAQEQAKNAQAGEVKIIHDTQTITKVIHDAAKTDKCVDANVPDAINAGLR